jgi:antitoxin component of MazEF toxin-antitoxin module
MPQLELRTVSKVGGNSLMITLPKGWLRFHGVKAGDKVEVVSNGELRVRPIRNPAASVNKNSGSTAGQT